MERKALTFVDCEKMGNKRFLWSSMVLAEFLFLTGCAAQPQSVEKEQKMAVILPGKIDDQDYNQLAYDAGQQIAEKNQVPVEYFQEVSVPSMTTVIEKISQEGYTIVWLHGSQYTIQAENLADTYPRLVFILEFDNAPENISENVWLIDRNYQQGMYVLGRLAAEKTRTGKVGYIYGLNLPLSFIEMNAITQAFQDSRKPVQLISASVGDFNDPQLAGLETDKLLDEHVDVILGSVNLGMRGVIDEVNSRGGELWFISKYTDKSTLSPEHYLSSFLMDFSVPIQAILSAVAQGRRSGYYDMDFGKGLSIQIPVENVDPEINHSINLVLQDVIAGKIKIAQNPLPALQTTP